MVFPCRYILHGFGRKLYGNKREFAPKIVMFTKTKKLWTNPVAYQFKMTRTITILNFKGCLGTRTDTTSLALHTLWLHPWLLPKHLSFVSKTLSCFLVVDQHFSYSTAYFCLSCCQKFGITATFGLFCFQTHSVASCSVSDFTNWNNSMQPKTWSLSLEQTPLFSQLCFFCLIVAAVTLEPSSSSVGGASIFMIKKNVPNKNLWIIQ